MEKKKMRIRSVCLALVMVMIMTLMPMTMAYGETTPPAPQQAAEIKADMVTYNGTAYPTLDAAMEMVNDSDAVEDIIQLQSDVTIDGVNETGMINKNITLDFNGFTISGTVDGALIQVGTGKTLNLRKGTITNHSTVAEALAVSGTIKVPVELVIAPAAWQTAKSITVGDKEFSVTSTTKLNGTASTVGGTVTPSNKKAVYGSTLVLDVTPAEGYEVKSVIVNGEYKGKENQLTLTNITANQKIEVDFVPRSVYIMLDPGHGSTEVNQVGTYKEHERMWLLANYMKDELSKYAGFVVDMTKNSVSETPAVYGRGQMSQGYDLLISLHSNWTEYGSIDYPLSIVSSGDALYAKAAPIGTKLASVVQTTMGTNNKYQLWTKKQSDGRDWYGVIRGAASVDTPAVILEHSFHSNTAARNYLLTDAGLRRLAVAEAAVLASHYGLTVKETTTTTTYSPKRLGVTLTGIKVRKSPSDYAGIISNLSPGLTIKLDGVVVDYNGKSWYKIYTNNQYCYIPEKDVKLVNATTQAAKYIGYSPSIVGYTSKRMIVRSTTSERSVGIGTFRKDTSIKLNGLYTGSDGVQWYKVITNKQTGYVLKREVNLKPVEVSPPAPPAPPAPAATYTAYSPSKLSLALTGMTVYSKPSATSVGIGTFRVGTILKLNGLYTTSAGVKWYKVYTNGKYGYILAKNVTFLTYTGYSPSKLAVTNIEMIVRSTLYSGAPGIGRFKAGITIKLNGLYTGANGAKWYKVYTNGKYGYIQAKHVTLK